MPRTKSMAYQLNIICNAYNWTRSPRVWFYDPDEEFTRDGERVRVITASMLGGASNMYVIEHLTPAWRKLWYVRLGTYHREPWNKLHLVPHIILKCKHGKPEFTFNKFVVEHFLTREKKPRANNPELMAYNTATQWMDYPQEIKNLEAGY